MSNGPGNPAEKSVQSRRLPPVFGVKPWWSRVVAALVGPDEAPELLEEGNSSAAPGLREMGLHPLSLAFSGELEALFLEAYFRRSLKYVRLVLLLATILYAAFGVLDALLIPDMKSLMWLIRYAVVCPVILFIFLVSFSPHFKKIMQALVSGGLILAGLGLIVMIVIAPAPVNYSYYAGLIFVFIFGYTSLKLRFVWATAASWVILACYEVAAVGFTDTSLPILINNNFFFVSSNVIGMLAGYSIEYYARRDFFLARQLTAEQGKVSAANRELERRIAERTNELRTTNERLRSELTERKRAEQSLKIYAAKNARLFQAERARFQEAETLRQAVMAVTASLSLDETLARILEELERVVPYDSASVQFYRNGSTEIVSGRGFADPDQVIGLQFPVPGDNPNTVVMETRRPLILRDAQSAHAPFREPPHDHIRSWLGVPLSVRDRVSGILSVDSVKPGYFSEAHVRLITPFANQAAIAIENARLFEAEQQQREMAEALHRASLALTSTLTLEQVFERILIELKNVVPYDSASVQLLKGDQLEIIGGHGFSNLPDLLGVRFPARGDNPNSLVLESKLPVIFDDVIPHYPAFDQGPHAPANIHGWLGVPLMIGERVIGMLALDKHEPGFYSREHAQAAMAYASPAAIAIENARLYEQAQYEIGERKRVEATLKTYAARLERSNRELQDFAYVASHDLREPLRKVQAFGERLQAGYAEVLDERGRDYVERMQSAAVRMQTLIDGLLTYSRVTTKARPFEPVDLAQVTREVLCDLELQIERVGGRVDVGDLPTIEADPTQMRQLLQNLIGNALKFCRTDTPPVVRVRAEILNGAAGELADLLPAGDVCQLRVEDNGIGFDEAYLDRIFQVFQRLHGRSTYEGAGIGLATCRKIAERHGGHITARSTPGQGSTFIVTLPANQPQGENGL